MARRSEAAQGRAKAKAQTKGKARTKTTAMKKLTKFHKFPELPPELRLYIIEAAIDEDQKERRARVMVLDDKTRRISPMLDTVYKPSPLLFVNVEFRQRSLQTYIKLNVLTLGPVNQGQYGEEDDWYKDQDELHYDPLVAQHINEEAEEAESQGLVVGCIYINPEKDVFIIGSIPIQIAETSTFRLIVRDETALWNRPDYLITERLPVSDCAKIKRMRELKWDPTRGRCLACRRRHRPHNEQHFFRGRGQITPRYDAKIYSGLNAFGFYIMTENADPHDFLSDVTLFSSKKFVEEWESRFYNVF